jgi:hypothetical protein
MNESPIAKKGGDKQQAQGEYLPTHSSLEQDLIALSSNHK